jgi:hypothetical protein
VDIDLVAMKAQVDLLRGRLNGAPGWGEIRSIYMDLAPLIGEIQGAVSTRSREAETQTEVEEAAAALERLKSSARRVGADIRLGSVPGLTMGLWAALNEAMAAIDCLEKSLAE